MPVVDRVATAVTPAVLIIGKYFGWTRRLLVWQDLLRTDGPVTGDLIALVGGRRRAVRSEAPPDVQHQPAGGREVARSTSLPQFIELVEKLGIAYDVMPVGPARRARITLNAVS
jgi:hypothetical protein